MLQIPLRYSMPTAFLFDMDGTLTIPRLDFDQIKREMGIGDGPILESLENLIGEQKIAAAAVLHRHERESASNADLMEGCHALLRWIDDLRIPRALITRNSRQSVDTVLSKHQLQFDVVISRDDCRHKPHPDPLFLACEKLRVDVKNAWMIGDGSYDVKAGIAAGAKTIWISHRRARDFTEEPWQVMDDLLHLMNWMKKYCAQS